ncbi:MAG: hypothetical protein CSA18_04745 [Deltaproteobacteria bacterium]|nr:MAG: hypothetical protein CSA18_04745 [Deltaproteobacteria bacterium]
MKKVLYILVILIVAYVISIIVLHRKIDRWEWDETMTENLKFPKDFIWGTASASYQVEGGHGIEDSWGWWETQKKPDGTPRVEGKNGIGNDEWNKYMQDIENMKLLGVDSYRFSISWSKIEPQKGVINEEALAHYDLLINDLLKNNIIPMITLHHFSHPTWFEKIGAFDKEENSTHFVNFAKIVFERYADRVKLWATFNEPVVYAYGRHIDLNHPNPYQEADFNRLGIMLKNTLIAHDEVYKTCKVLPNGKTAKIGIVKSMMQMDPYSTYDLGDQIMAYYADKLFLKSYLNYFEKGVFDFQAFPVGADVVYQNKNNVGKNLDFTGLNYYSHNAFNFEWTTFDIDKASKPLYYPGEIHTDLDYGFYPEGLYRAIREISVLNKPIYITENGIGVGPEREELRQKHLKTALYDVNKALKEGYDVRAYYYWSLNDNFEWDLGFSKKFGLFSVDRNTLERKPKKTALLFKSYIKNSRE